MRVKTFMQLLEQLKQLTPRQRNVLAHHLGDPNLSPAAGFPETIPIPEHCPHCQAQANQLGKWGRSQPVLVVRDHSGQTADFKQAKLDEPHVIAVLQALIEQDAILCTDSAGVYAVFARTVSITHRQINIRQGRRVVEGAFHIQNVNAYDNRLKGWMRRFHGVATKYLEDYLGWRRMLERYKHHQPRSLLG